MPRLERRFDWDECRHLRAEGWTLTRLAEHFGVSDRRVSQVCNPAVMERTRAAIRRWQMSGECPDCGGQTTRVKAGRSLMCRACYAKRQSREAFERRLDAAGNVYCSRCGAHKPSDAFRLAPPERMFPYSWCRACEADARLEHRHAHPEIEAATVARLRERRRRARMETGKAGGQGE